MTNEDIIKRDGYRGQITTFSLRMEDEMKTANDAEWIEFSKTLVELSSKMSASVEELKAKRG